MAVWCRWDKFELMEMRDGCIWRVKKIGEKWFKMGDTSVPEKQSEVGDIFYVPTCDPCVIAPTEPQSKTT